MTVKNRCKCWVSGRIRATCAQLNENVSYNEAGFFFFFQVQLHTGLYRNSNN